MNAGALNLGDALEILSSAVILGVGLVILALVAVWVSESIADHLGPKDKDD